MRLLSAENADSVADCLDGAECPAGSAGSLVSDVSDGFALGPGVNGTEILREIVQGFDFLNPKLIG